MAKNSGGKGGGAAGGGPAMGHTPFTKCLRTTNAPTQDASRKLKGPSVSSGATRSTTAPYYGGQKLGPRTA